MPELVTLTEDCNLGPAGLQVWVDDPAEAEKPKRGRPTKKAAAKKASAAHPDEPDEGDDQGESSD